MKVLLTEPKVGITLTLFIYNNARTKGKSLDELQDFLIKLIIEMILDVEIKHEYGIKNEYNDLCDDIKKNLKLEKVENSNFKYNATIPFYFFGWYKELVEKYENYFLHIDEISKHLVSDICVRFFFGFGSEIHFYCGKNNRKKIN